MYKTLNLYYRKYIHIEAPCYIINSFLYIQIDAILQMRVFDKDSSVTTTPFDGHKYIDMVT
jgi:hypothetical protein